MGPRSRSEICSNWDLNLHAPIGMTRPMPYMLVPLLGEPLGPNYLFILGVCAGEICCTSP